LILITIDEGESCKVGCSFDDWEAVRVPDDLGVVVIDDRRCYPVCTGRKVDYGWTGGRRLARSRSTASAATDGQIDRCGVVVDAIAFTVSVSFVQWCWVDMYLWRQRFSHYGRLGRWNLTGMLPRPDA